jgi:putative transposase
VDCQHPSLSVVRQCALLGISRSSVYYQPVRASQENLVLMKLIHQQYLERPFYGSRRMAAWLRNQGYSVNRKRVRRLMGMMGLRAIYRHPRTVSRLLATGCTRTCYMVKKLPGPTRCGPRITPTSPWPEVSCIW